MISNRLPIDALFAIFLTRGRARRQKTERMNMKRALCLLLLFAFVPCERKSLDASEVGAGSEDLPLHRVRIGLFGIGLDTYWPQFEGLYERLEGYQTSIAERMSSRRADIEIINAGIVDNPVKARQTGARLRAEGVEAVFLNISTYALSSTVLPVVQKLQVPVIVLSMQPTKAIDYMKINSLKDRGEMTGEWLAYCQACSAPEIASVFNRAHIDYHLIAGSMDDESMWREIDGWLDALYLASELRRTRVGTLGHYYGGMLDVYSDMTQLSSVFGCHFEIVEMMELKKLRSSLSRSQVEEELGALQIEFDVDPDCDEGELIRAAKTSAALDLMIKKSL